VGVGSVNACRALALIMAANGDPIFLAEQEPECAFMVETSLH
jgi:hypothetical protein